MDKISFLDCLRAALDGLPKHDIEERIGFYAEMIDDCVEEGMSEEEAVREMGSVEDIASQIVSETPLSRLVKERVRPKRKLSAWEITLIALGSPIWGTLGIAAIAVVFSLIASLGAVTVSLWAAAASVGVSGIGGAAAMLFLSIQGYVWTGLCFLGAGFVLAGISIFGLYGCKRLTVLSFVLSKKLIYGIKIMVAGRRRDV